MDSLEGYNINLIQPNIEIHKGILINVAMLKPTAKLFSNELHSS